MKFLRRILGTFVMIAGILGLGISLAGLVGLWMVKPSIEGYAKTTIDTLNTSLSTSQQTMEITGQALGATVDSVDALSEMLGTTAAQLEETKPVIVQLNTIMSDTVPSTLASAADSLKTAQQAAEVLDGAIKSLESFQFLLSGNPLLSSFIQLPEQPYNPEVPLADSLGALAANLESLPDQFTKMSEDLEKTDDNLDSIQGNLITMSESVKMISKALGEYQAMIGQSQASMKSLTDTLINIQNNLPNILNGVATGLSLFLVWLLVTQVVIFSQGWELFQGTAGRMEGGPQEVQAAKEPDSKPADSKPADDEPTKEA